jgi:hypothetical protein
MNAKQPVTFDIRTYLAGFEGNLLTMIEMLTPDETAYLFLRMHQIVNKYDPTFNIPTGI